MPRLFQSPIVLIFITILTIIFYISLSKTAQKNASVATQIESTQEENQKLQEKNQILEQKLQSVNPEQMIRDEFLLQKEGEYVVKIPSYSSETEETTRQKNPPNWRKWLELIF